MKPRRIDALRALIERPGRPAEGAAAKAALEKVMARGAAHRAAPAEQNRSGPSAAQGHRPSQRQRDDAEHGTRRAGVQHRDAGVKRFVKRASLPAAIAILLIAFEFFFGLNWHPRKNATLQETGWQPGIHLNPLESERTQDKEHPAPGQPSLLQYDLMGPVTLPPLETDPLEPGSQIKGAK
jgi:hypothetical protein